MTLLETLAVFAPPLLLGAALLRVLGIGLRTDPLAYLGWAWQVGALALAVTVFAWFSIDGPVSRRALTVVTLLLSAVLWFLPWRARAPAPVPALPAALAAAPRLEVWFFAAVVVLLLVRVLTWIAAAADTPVTIGDEGQLWAAKAKLLFCSGGFAPTLGAAMERAPFVLHAEYPPLNPLLQLWVFVQHGEVTHFANRLPIQAYAIAQLLIAAAALRRVTRPGVAAALLILLQSHAFTRSQTLTAMADLMLATALLTALDAWLRFRATGRRRFLKLALVLLGALVWTKQEGAGIAAVLGGLFLVAGRWRLGAPAWWLLAPLLFAAHWLVNVRHGFQSDLASTALWGENPLARGMGQAGGRLRPLVEHFVDNVLWAPRTQRGLLAALALALLLRPAAWRDPGLRVVIATITVTLLGYQLVFLLTPHDLAWHLETASARIAYHVIPAATLAVAMLLGPFALPHPVPASRSAP